MPTTTHTEYHCERKFGYPSSPRRITHYGFLGTLVAVCCAASLILINTKEQECTRSSYQQLQAYNSVGLVAGVVLLVGALFCIAEFLHSELPALFHVVSFGLLLLGGLFCYSAAYTYWRPCQPLAGLIPTDAGLGIDNNRNVFNAEDGKMIATFFLQIAAAVGLIVSAFDFYSCRNRLTLR